MGGAAGHVSKLYGRLSRDTLASVDDTAYLISRNSKSFPHLADPYFSFLHVSFKQNFPRMHGRFPILHFSFDKHFVTQAFQPVIYFIPNYP